MDRLDDFNRGAAWRVQDGRRRARPSKARVRHKTPSNAPREPVHALFFSDSYYPSAGTLKRTHGLYSAV